MGRGCKAQARRPKGAPTRRIFTTIPGSVQRPVNVRFVFKSGLSAAVAECPLSANRVTSRCKKSSDLSRRQTTMKSATDLPNADPQHLREMTLRSA